MCVCYRLIPPDVQITLDFAKSESNWLIQDLTNMTTLKLTVSYEDAEIWVKRSTVASDISNGLTEHNMKEPMSFPFSAINLHSLYVGEGAYTLPFNTLSLETSPSRVIVAFLRNDSFIGTPSRPCFVFENFDVSQIFIRVGGEIYPSYTGLIPEYNYDNDNFCAAYMSLYEALSCTPDSGFSNIDFVSFKRFLAIYVFDLSLFNPGLQDPTKKKPTSLHVTFRKSVPKGGLTAIVLTEIKTSLLLYNKKTFMISPPVS